MLNGRWPKVTSGRIGLAVQESWRGVDNCALERDAGTPWWLVTMQLLADRRSVRNMG